MLREARLPGAETQTGFHEVPIVDLAPLRLGAGREKLVVAHSIDRALQRVGFFYVINHGVAPALISDLFAQSVQFFNLPRAEKEKVSIDRSGNHRGYFSVGRENVDPTVTVDLKEGFDIGNDMPIGGCDHGGMRGDNLWPEQPQGIRPAMNAYYKSIHDLAKDLCRAMALALDLQEDAFEHALKNPESRLRLLHYPPQGPLPLSNSLGAGAHKDCGCLTILAQDNVGGLEVQNSEGVWIPVEPVPDSFVINVGDFMAFWSNGRYVSTRHRVISHPSRHRYSIPLFLNPNFDLEVKGFQSLIGLGECEKTSVSGYLRQCYNEIRS